MYYFLFYYGARDLDVCHRDTKSTPNPLVNFGDLELWSFGGRCYDII
jgi:hypothetical protein